MLLPVLVFDTPLLAAGRFIVISDFYTTLYFGGSIKNNDFWLKCG
jgi:hypothetical protein